MSMKSIRPATALKSLPFLLVFVTLHLSVAPYSAGEPFEEAIEDKLNSPLIAEISKRTTTGVWWETIYRSPHSNYIRLHFSEITSPKNAEYQIRVTAMNNTVLLEYPAGQFSRFSDFLSEPIFAEEIKIKVVGPGDLTGLSFKIDRVVHDTKSAQFTLKSYGVGRSKLINSISTDDHFPKELLESVNKVEEAVAKLSIGKWTCTGFLTEPDVILTNYHCLKTSWAFQNTQDNKKKSPEACRDIAVIFDYYDSEHAPRTESPCLTVLDFDEKLDYAALRVDRGRIKIYSPSGERDRIPLTLSTKEWNDKETADVFVIHHPKGKPKEVSFRCQIWFKKESKTLDHDCNTHRGSSGAPLISVDGSAAVGLHYSGSYDPTKTAEEADLEGQLNSYNLAQPSYIIKQSYVASGK
jgi:Trypsin-like peptidase domain